VTVLFAFFARSFSRFGTMRRSGRDHQRKIHPEDNFPRVNGKGFELDDDCQAPTLYPKEAVAQPEAISFATGYQTPSKDYAPAHPGLETGLVLSAREMMSPEMCIVSRIMLEMIARRTHPIPILVTTCFPRRPAFLREVSYNCSRCWPWVPVNSLNTGGNSIASWNDKFGVME
jgi:hypothetical protein